MGDGLKVVHDTRIGNQNIQAAVVCFDLAKHPLDVLGLGEVGGQGDDLTGIGLVFDFLDQTVQPLLTAGYGVNLATLFSCQDGGCPANARGSPGNDHNLVGKSHAKYLPFCPVF